MRQWDAEDKAIRKLFIKKETLAQVFSWEFCEIFKSTFSYKTRMVAASDSKAYDETQFPLGS